LPALPVTYLFSRTCPSHEEGLALLREAAARAGRDVDVTALEVLDDAQARELDFVGSPTYLVGGRDVAEREEDLPRVAEACRVYALPGGRLGPLPALDDLVAALRRAP
jgi:hypothetical protein